MPLPEILRKLTSVAKLYLRSTGWPLMMTVAVLPLTYFGVAGALGVVYFFFSMMMSDIEKPPATRDGGLVMNVYIMKNF